MNTDVLPLTKKIKFKGCRVRSAALASPLIDSCDFSTLIISNVLPQEFI